MLTAQQCIPACDNGHADSRGEHALPVFSAVYYLVHEVYDTGQTVLEIMEDHSGFHPRSPQKSMHEEAIPGDTSANRISGLHKSLPGAPLMVLASDYYHSEWD